MWFASYFLCHQSHLQDHRERHKVRPSCLFLFMSSCIKRGADCRFAFLTDVATIIDLWNASHSSPPTTRRGSCSSLLSESWLRLWSWWLVCVFQRAILTSEEQEDFEVRPSACCWILSTVTEFNLIWSQYAAVWRDSRDWRVIDFILDHPALPPFLFCLSCSEYVCLYNFKP